MTINIGNEVDLIADFDGKLMPIEIKAGQTLNQDFFTGLERWTTLDGDHAVSPTLVYGGTETMTRKGTRVVNWRTITSGLAPA